MFIPFGDNNPTTRTPYVNYLLIVINVVIFLCVNFQPQAVEVLLKHAINPEAVTFATMVSYMFLHGGLLHIGGNMLFLYVYGDNVEDKLGHIGYLVFYLCAGFMAAFFHVSTSTKPCIGASGAMAGVMGAYVVFFPSAKVRCLNFFWLLFVLLPFLWLPVFLALPVFVMMIYPLAKQTKKTIDLYAWFIIGYWFLGEYLRQTSSGADSSGVAHAAHVGGFVLGGIAAGVLLLSNVVKNSKQKPSAEPRQPAAPPQLDLGERLKLAKEAGVPCPACLMAMRPNPTGGFEVEVCYLCGGMWLEKGETEKLLTREQLPYSLLNPPSSSQASVLVPHGQRGCPKCEDPLQVADIEGVDAEGCCSCGGLWLERGELKELREKLGYSE